MKLSRWFDITKDWPKHKGFYQCKCCKDLFYWHGKGWKYAKSSKLNLGVYEVHNWRGILK